MGQIEGSRVLSILDPTTSAFQNNLPDYLESQLTVGPEKEGRNSNEKADAVIQEKGLHPRLEQKEITGTGEMAWLLGVCIVLQRPEFSCL